MRTVNLSRYLQSGNAGGEAKALLEAFEHDGFAYLEGYQALVPQELVNTVLSYNEQFFQLPPEKKAALAFKSSLENRGYLKLGQEQASMSKDSKVIGSEREAHPDQKETWDLGNEIHPTFSNKWPAEEDLPNFKSTMLEYFDRMDQLHKKILSLIAVALDLGPQFFDKEIDQGSNTLRLLHYPPSSRKPGHESRLGAHTDFGTITLLFQDQTGGLQIQNPEGLWVDVIPKADTCVANVGSVGPDQKRTVNLSSDCEQKLRALAELKSTIHRAVAPPLRKGESPNAMTRVRASVAYFCNPNPEAIISCIPSLGPAEWPPVKSEDYIAQSIGNETML